MPHIHWVERQNKLEIPKEKDEVNKREVHECDVRTRDPKLILGRNEVFKEISFFSMELKRILFNVLIKFRVAK